jgi:hypothetical protein
MTDRKNKFLLAILGPDGASALQRASERSEILGQALLPRSVLAWVSGVGEFEGFIPGTDDLLSRITKSEKGFSGHINSHEFNDASLIHVSAAIAVALGADENCNDAAKSFDLERLGKSLDLLVRSKLVQEELVKAEKVACKCPKDKHVEKCPNKPKEDLAKAGMEPPVKNAAPVAPAAPIAANQTPAVKPAAPAAVAKAPKVPKPAGATVALTRSEMEHLCPACASANFTGNELTPCICFTALKKSIDILAMDELGCVIHISEPMADVVTFLEALGRT